MKIAKDSVVTITYTLKDTEGNIKDTTEGKDPLTYIHGMGHLIPGVEKNLEGRISGDQISFVVSPDEAYGYRNEELIHDIPHDQFEDPHELDVGMEFEAQTEYGPIIVQIIDVNDDFVVVDGNHPLAGIDLEFSISILEVREATEEEKRTGEIDEPKGMTQ